MVNLIFSLGSKFTIFYIYYTCLICLIFVRIAQTLCDIVIIIAMLLP